MRTYSPKPGDADKKWYVIDANDAVLGRLSAQVATLLRGKHKPTFAPNADMGDYVIVINADKVVLTGKKLELPVKKLLLGHAPEQVVKRDALAQPGSLDWYIAYAEQYLRGASEAG